MSATETEESVQGVDSDDTSSHKNRVGLGASLYGLHVYVGVTLSVDRSREGGRDSIGGGAAFDVAVKGRR